MHVPEDDPPGGDAERPRRLDELALPQRQHLGAHDPGEPGPVDDAIARITAVRPGCSMPDEDDRHQQQREAPGQVDERS